MLVPRLASWLVATALLSLGGCATYVPYDPQGGAWSGAGVAAQAAAAPLPGLTVQALLQMLAAGRPQAEIAADLQAQGRRTALAPADIDVLLAAGAQPDLIIAAQGAPTYAQPSIVTGDAGGVLAVAGGYPAYTASPAYPWFPFGIGLGLGLGWVSRAPYHGPRIAPSYSGGHGYSPGPRGGVSRGFSGGFRGFSGGFRGRR